MDSNVFDLGIMSVSTFMGMTDKFNKDSQPEKRERERKEAFVKVACHKKIHMFF